MQETLLSGIVKPGRYIGGEVNSYRGDFDEARVRFALAFPDVYEVGSSHLGLQLLYHCLNGMGGVMADRAYAPWFDFEERLRKSGETLRCVESERPLRDFDFVGFSLQYELSYTNILTMLDLGGIPFEAKDRGPGDPWVIAGGPCAFNPEPLAPFLDFVVLGEAEEVLPEIVRVFLDWKEAGGARAEFLERIRSVAGVYVPSFFKPEYGDGGVIRRLTPIHADYVRVKKRLITDLDQFAPIPESPVVPLLDIVHNRLGLEIARGCTRGCRFCQAGFIYRPVRERDPAVVLQKAERALSQSGFEEISLLSLSTGDYCRVQDLLAALMERLLPEKVAVSFPSMRVGTLTPELMKLIKKVRKTGFTMAPEAGSERLRRIINKGVLDSDLLEASENAFKLGWRLIKLYFMIGLPGETQQDLDDMVRLCMEVWKLAKPSRSSVNVSASTFVPKPMTPFQWAPQFGGDEIREKLEFLKARLNRSGMRLKWSHPGHSLLEAVFARGDRRLARTLAKAWELGARFDGWTEKFDEDLWDRAFRESGVDPSFYAHRERQREEILPWDHLSAGVDKDFLWTELEKAFAGEFTPDCRREVCSGCGVCDHEKIAPRLYGEDESPLAKPKAEVRNSREESFLYWIRYSKLGKIRFFGQLEIAQALSRAIRRSKLPAAYSEGFHPHVKLSFVEALPLGFESRIEEAYITLTQRLDPEVIHSRLNICMPEGLRIEAVKKVVKRIPRPDNVKVTYLVSGLPPRMVRDVIDGWSGRLGERVVKKTKRKEVSVELGDVLFGIRQLSESSIEMDLREVAEACLRPTNLLSHLLGEGYDAFSGCRICKVANG